MASAGSSAGEIVARLVYFGSDGSGKTANVEFIHRKLKKGHRGDLRVTEVPGTGASFEVLPVQLGMLQGFRTSIYVHTVPGGPSNAPVRRRILEQADGIVFVADLRPAQHDATLTAFAELREHLAHHGRRLEDVTLVIQYNHRDEADENAVEELHRRLAVQPAASFEATAKQGRGVLEALTSISKFIVQRLRTRAQSGPPPEPAPPVEVRARPRSPRPDLDVDPVTSPSMARMSPPDLSVPDLDIPVPDLPAPQQPAAAPALSISGKDISVESVGAPEFDATSVRIPIRLAHERAGSIEITLRLALGSE